MKKCILLLVLTIALSLCVISCTPADKTPEEVLAEIKLDESSFNELNACQQVEIFAEVGYQYMDIDHQ